MSFTITGKVSDPDHEWTSAIIACNLTDDKDAFVADVVATIRLVYGETLAVEIAEDEFADEIDSGEFELNNLRDIVREGFPDLDEGDRPPHLKNSRSEPAELVARMALRAIYSIQFPVAGQIAKGYANGPILGFDGWGVCEVAKDDFALVLMQVKATDEPRSPPPQATILAEECKVAWQTKKLSRALMSMLGLAQDKALRKLLVKMLHDLKTTKRIRIIISPVIVRGLFGCHLDDLLPVRGISAQYAPAQTRAISLRIGAQLEQFGSTVILKARAAT